MRTTARLAIALLANLYYLIRVVAYVAYGLVTAAGLLIFFLIYQPLRDSYGDLWYVTFVLVLAFAIVGWGIREGPGLRSLVSRWGNELRRS